MTRVSSPAPSRTSPSVAHAPRSLGRRPRSPPRVRQWVDRRGAPSRVLDLGLLLPPGLLNRHPPGALQTQESCLLPHTALRWQLTLCWLLSCKRRAHLDATRYSLSLSFPLFPSLSISLFLSLPFSTELRKTQHGGHRHHLVRIQGAAGEERRNPGAPYESSLVLSCLSLSSCLALTPKAEFADGAQSSDAG